MDSGVSLTDLRIQPATIRMIGMIMRLERLCFQEDAWPWADVASILLWPSVVRLGALDGSRLIGFVAGDRHWKPRTGMIATLAVHPDYRRRGVGRRLLAECEARLDAPVIRLTVRVDNLPAIALYEGAGYQKRDTLAGYYTHGVAGLLMEKVREAPE
jgi:ribosomal protein S18 acetylase RimI-like enzyme